MKTIKIFILTLIASMSITSCEFLEKEPNQITPGNYFKNAEEATSFLTGVYATLQQSTFYGNAYLFLVGGDDLGHYGGVGRTPNKTGLICNNATSSDPDVLGLWYTLYTGINRANVFLENVDAVPDMDDNLRLQYKAEARFLRAFFYFNLVECWGDVPFTTESTIDPENLARPRTDKQEIYDFIIREMSGAANNLKSASDLNYLPGRVSKSAAWGILARVYMFRAGEHFRDKKTSDPVTEKEYFKKASYYAQQVLKEGHDLDDKYWNLFIDICSNKYNSSGKNESIWEVEFAGNRSTDVRAEGRIGNIIGIVGPDLSATSYKGQDDPGFGYGFVYATPKLLDLYEANNDIDRCNWNIAPFTYTQSKKGGPVDGRYFEFQKMNEVREQYWDISFSYGPEGSFIITDPETGKTETKRYGDYEKTKSSSDNNRNRACAKYRREYEADKKSKNDTSINFPILRFSDILLMIAEAENEVNRAPNSLAYDCINRVRKRAGIGELKDLDYTQFQSKLKDERAMELCFEYTRRFDLIRWGEYVEKMNELVSVAQAGGSWTQGATNVFNYFNISSAYNYFPIPAQEIAMNPLITKNNQGW